ncbi:hypothetical protein [Arthrobacter castelli]|uniref:hypothetical protein n=1 Tax=Arthrobacter castelli TaxID=271431 RepID=UPI000428E606|nr:hypothetical protein [Arthrobacter castelli]
MVDKGWLAEDLEDAEYSEAAESRDSAKNPEDPANGVDAANGEPDSAGGRYSELPEPVRAEDMIATKDTRPVPDPKMGRDTETDFLLRNAGGFG